MEKNSVILILDQPFNYFIYQKDTNTKTPVKSRMHIIETIEILCEEKSICAEDVVNIINTVMLASIPNLPANHPAGSDRIVDELTILRDLLFIRDINQAQIDLNNMQDLPKCIWEEDPDNVLVCNIYFAIRDEEGEDTEEKACSGLLYSQQEALNWIDTNKDEIRMDVMEVLKLKEQIEKSGFKKFDEFYTVELPENIESLSLISKN